MRIGRPVKLYILPFAFLVGLFGQDRKVWLYVPDQQMKYLFGWVQIPEIR